MKKSIVVFGFAGVLALLAAAFAQKQKPVHEIHSLFLDDQKDRENLSTEEQWQKVKSRDKERRERARKLMDAGELSSGQDFHDAAFIFQHSEVPEDNLFAHILASVGVSKGDPESRWISAATLDRYLQSINQPQVFGTQFKKAGSDPFTQQPYNQTLLSDSLRKELCVSALADQQGILDTVNHGGKFKSTNVCH